MPENVQRLLRLAQFTVNRVADSVFWIDSSARILYVNDTACITSGYTRDELVGEAFVRIAPDLTAETWKAHWEKLKRRGSFSFESSYLRKDKRSLETEFTVNYICFDRGEYSCAFVRDLTERKQIERKLQQQQHEMWRLDRINTVGQMAIGIAHELNQPLAAILNYSAASAEAMRHRDLPKEKLQQTLDSIAAEAIRAGEIIRWLRTFVRKQVSNAGVTEINAVIVESLGMLKHSMRLRGIVLRKHFGDGLPCVAPSAVAITQVLTNVLRNAVESMESKSNERVLSVTTSLQGSHVQVEVADTGCGLRFIDVDRIFEPFFTTKRDGLGIGLAICKSIVADWGGDIAATPRPEGGLSISFTLPLRSSRQPKEKDDGLSN